MAHPPISQLTIFARLQQGSVRKLLPLASINFEDFFSMKLSSVLVFLVGAVRVKACPYLRFTVGGESPHEEQSIDMEAEVEYGHLRRLQRGPGGGGTHPAPSPRTP